jgi:RNA polymerase sigma factor (sigma-70 family)
VAGVVRLRPAVTAEEWYAKLAGRLHRYAAKFGIPADEAEELVHDVFLSYLTTRKEIGDPPRWFFGAVRFACLSYIRKRGRIENVETLPERSVDPDEVARIAARELLRTLSDVEQRVLWMQAAEGRKVAEIAERMGRSVSWTEKLLRRAKRDAAELLDPSDDETHRCPACRAAPRADTFAERRRPRRLARRRPASAPGGGRRGRRPASRRDGGAPPRGAGRPCQNSV